MLLPASNDVEVLSNALHAYSTYLKQHNEQQQHVHSLTKPACSVSRLHFVLIIHSHTWTQFHCMNQCVSMNLLLLIVLSGGHNLSLSMCICIEWLQWVLLPTFGRLIHLFLITRNEMLMLVSENLPKYSTRDMKRTFVDKYTDVFKLLSNGVEAHVS